MRSYIDGAGHKTIEALAADAQSANRMIGVQSGGGKVLQVPSVDRAADPAGWAEVDKAFGVPENGQYGEFKPETGNLGLNADQIGVLDKNMHAVGAAPAMRDAALKTYHEMAAAQTQAEDTAWQGEVAAGNLKLKGDWGDKFDQNIKVADRALEDQFGEEFVKLMAESGMTEHPLMREAGYKLATLTAEAAPVTTGDQPGGGMTKASAEAELAKIEASDAFNNGEAKATARRVELLTIIGS